MVNGEYFFDFQHFSNMLPQLCLYVLCYKLISSFPIENIALLFPRHFYLGPK